MTWASRTLLLLLAVSATATTPTAIAAPTAPADLGVRAAGIADLQTTAAADGSATLVYSQDERVFVSTKQPGAPFPTPADLGGGFGVQLAASTAGRSILAWITQLGPAATLRIALREPGAVQFTDLAVTPAANAVMLDAHVAADGRAYVAWGNDTDIELLTIAPGSTSITPAMTVPASGLTGLAIGSKTSDSSGWVLATSQSSGTARTTLRRWSVTLGASPIDVLSTATNSTTGVPGFTTTTSHLTSSPTVISGAAPAFFWDARTSVNSSIFSLSTTTTELRRVDENASTTPPVLVSSLSGGIVTGETTRFDTVAATDDLGAGLVAWGTRSGLMGAPISNIQIARHAASGVWEAPITLPGLFPASPPSSLKGVALARGASNGAQLAYVRNDELLTARLAPDGALNPAAPSVLPLAATDSPSGTIVAAGVGNGDTAIAWSVSGPGGATSGVQVSYDDVTPPTLTAEATSSTAIPAIGFTDQAAADRFNESLRRRSYRATTTDLWTASTVTWDFGDGATATGTEPVHQFATPGKKTITVTARDAGGNTTTRTLTDDVPSVSGPAPAQPPSSDRPTAARLISASLSPKRFRPTRGAIAKGRGTTVSFQLTAPASIEFTVLQQVRGFRASKGSTRCVATRPKGKATARCTVTKSLVTNPVIAGVAGANTAPFRGRTVGGALKPGSYKLRVAVKGSTDGAIELPFTIRR